MNKNRTEGALDIVRGWLNEVGGGLSLGESSLKSVKVSKSGDKVTLVLKKKKAKKPEPTDNKPKP